MNNHRYSHGFSLIEVLASCVVLSLAALGITATWRLADYKALLARLDHRADRILREYYELQTFAPGSAKPFPTTPSEGGIPEWDDPQDPVAGFLYHPLKINSPKTNPQYDDLVSYTITSVPGSQLTLTYIVPGYGDEAVKSFTKTVTLNPLPTSTP
jgi:prepilin-type N-terminal cleavage/methylation domain-containing protein